MFSVASSPFVTPQPRSPGALQEDFLQPGRLVEVAGGGKATFCFRHCLRAMERGLTAAWITPDRGFAPLVALESLGTLPRLLTVHVPDGKGVLRAADLLLSCAGAVGVAVLEVPAGTKPSDAQLLRLQRLAERSRTALLIAVERPAQSPALGVVVSLRVALRREVADGRLLLQLNATRHKAGACGPLGKVQDEPNRLRLDRTV
jgi:hypothetical protein